MDLPADAEVPPGRGGTPVTQIARELLRRDIPVVLVTLDEHVRTPILLQGPRLRVHVGPYRQAHRARDAFREERRFVAQTLRGERVDVVHAHWTYEYALGALSSGHPPLVTVRDWAPTILRLQPGAYRAVRLAMNAVVLARAPHLTVTSPYMARHLRRWLRRRVPLIPNALEETVFSPPPGAPPGEKPLLLAVNNGFERRKNVGALLHAFARVRGAVPHASLRLVGRGYEDGGPAASWARSAGLQAGVEFVGHLPYDRMAEEFRSADLFVHPALEESFGMVLVEAMAQGTPVVAGHRSGAVPWVLGGGRAGVLTDVRQPATLARTILSMLTDKARWRDVAAAGYRRAFDHFRMGPVVDAYLRCYEEVRR